MIYNKKITLKNGDICTLRNTAGTRRASARVQQAFRSLFI